MRDAPKGRMLTRARLSEGVAVLCAADSDLAAVVDRFGAPPLWRRKPGFATLLCLILEQQVSLASARATWDRLLARLDGELAPDSFRTLDDTALREIGFSRQKARYARILAEEVACGGLRLDRLRRLDDDAVRAELTRITGIGRWTAEIYLLEALGRPDILPAGDLALQVAAERVKGLAARPDPGALTALADGWRPWRAVATRILWHYYLNTVRNGAKQTFP